VKTNLSAPERADTRGGLAAGRVYAHTRVHQHATAHISRALARARVRLPPNYSNYLSSTHRLLPGRREAECGELKTGRERCGGGDDSM